MAITTVGSWTSQTLDNSLGSFRTGFDGYWGDLSFNYEPGDSNSSVQVDILNSGGTTLQSNVTLTSSKTRKIVDLSQFNNVRSADIKIKIKLSAQTKSPIVSDILLAWKDTKLS